MGTPFFVAAAFLVTGMGAQDPTTQVDWQRDLKIIDDKPAASSVRPEDQSKPGVMLQCAGDKLSAIFAVEAIDFDGIEDVKTSRARIWTGKLFIDGELADERDWTYLPAAKAAWPRSKSVAAKVFNAVVQGQLVEFELGKKDRVRVHLPTADQAFAAFAEDCASFRSATAD